MNYTLLSIYDIGNIIGEYGCWAYCLIMAVAMVYVMRKYVK
jgi:hypothetical protein